MLTKKTILNCIHENEVQSLCDFRPYKEPQTHSCTVSSSEEDHVFSPFQRAETQYNFQSMLIQEDDEVQVVRGQYKGQLIGKVVQVSRKNYVTYIEWVQLGKANGTTVRVDIYPSKVCTTRIKLDKDHKKKRS